MKRISGVMFTNGQVINLDSTKTELVLDGAIRIPRKELNSFVRALRELSRNGSSSDSTKHSVIAGGTKLVWLDKPVPEFGETTLIKRVVVATQRSLGKRSVPRRELEDALEKQLKEPRLRIMPAVSSLIHQYELVGVKHE